jgi:hypothetical protein
MYNVTGGNANCFCTSIYTTLDSQVKRVLVGCREIMNLRLERTLGVAGAFDALNRHDLATFPGHQAASRWPMPPP